MVSDGPESPQQQPLLTDASSSGAVMVSRWRVDQANPPASDHLTTANAHSSNATAKAVSIPQSMPTRSVFRDKLLSLFVEDDVPNADIVRFTFGERNDWMSHVISLPAMTPALENALLAVCMARLGRHTAQPGLVHESLKLYTQGLLEIRRDIPDVSRRKSEQNLAACLGFLLYEITECPGGTPEAYFTHYRGTMKLLQMRGASAHTSGLAHSVFQILRMHAMFQGVVEFKNSFLADPEWCNIPWSAKPGNKAPFDKLVDILLVIPDLSAQRQALQHTVGLQQYLSDACNIIRDGQKVEAALDAWFDDFKATVTGPLYHPELSKIESVVDSPELGKLFPVAFHFPTFTVGQSLVYYWVALMSVYAHLCFTYDSMARFLTTLETIDRGNLPCICFGSDKSAECLRHSAMDLLRPLDFREEWPRTIAYNVCQSVEHFLLRKIRGFGPASVLPALALVKGFWKYAPGDWSRQIAWINDMLNQIRASGSGIAGLLGRD